MRFRRKTLTPELREAQEGFRTVLAHVEDATRVLTQAAPTTRYDGRPLAEVVAAFDEHLGRAIAGMGRWRVPQVEDVWDACAAGLSEARARADRLRREAPPIHGFEAIIGTIDGLIAPLEVFETAAERFRALRR
jgi:hypothetical protein